MDIVINVDDKLSKREFNKSQQQMDIVFIGPFSLNFGTIRNTSGVLLGLFNAYTCYDLLQLDAVEIFEEYRGLGIGTKFLKELFSLFPDIRSVQGTATKDSYSFYDSLGDDFRVEFHNNCSECILEENCDSECEKNSKIFNIELVK